MLNKDFKINRKKTLIFFVIIIICLWSFGLFTLVNALSVSPISIGNDYIEWNFSESITNLTIDGKYISNFNPNTSFILSGLTPESKHKITILNSLNEIADNETMTLPIEIEKSSLDILLDLILEYLFIILSIACLIISVVFRLPLFSIVALIVSLLGCLSALASGYFYYAFVFGIIFMSSILITTKVR